MPTAGWGWGGSAWSKYTWDVGQNLIYTSFDRLAGVVCSTKLLSSRGKRISILSGVLG